MNNLTRNILLWFVIALLMVGLFNLMNGGNDAASGNTTSYDRFVQEVESGNVSAVEIRGSEIRYQSSAGQAFSTVAPDDGQLTDRLLSKGVTINVADPDEDMPFFASLLLSWFPFLLLIAVYIFFMRQMQGGGGKAMGFGKSKARMLTENQTRVTFEDVAGVEEAKEELAEVVEFLRDPQKFQRLGGRIPKGALLVGPPGTGKTLLARSVAGEANVPFFTISGSEFVEMFVGVGASRVRDMFEQAKKNAPCIVFIDEIDAVGRHRGAGLGGGNDEREQTLNQLLVEMDGFEANEGVILLAATNRPDVLDPALLRPGRFDRQVVVPNPDLNGREHILKVHMAKVRLGPDVDAMVISRGTPGFSGADLANLVNEAALMAARRNKRVVTMADFEDAKDKIMMGSERRTMAMTDEEKKLTAYHEAGHAIVGQTMPDHDPLHKVTIIPRGRALGVNLFLPEQDQFTITKRKAESQIAVAFGGRIAEEMIFGEDMVTSGATNDIQQATGRARAMVMEWGMSEKLGRVRYNANEQEVFLGHSVAQTQNMSDETARLIDEEVRRIVEEGEAAARRVLTDKIDGLHRLSQALLDYETLTGDEVKKITKGDDIDRRPDEPAGGSNDHKTRSSVPPTGKKSSDGDSDTADSIDPNPQET